MITQASLFGDPIVTPRVRRVVRAVSAVLGVTALALLLSPSLAIEHGPWAFSPLTARVVAAFISELLMAAMALFMLVWGGALVETTWGNSVDEFPWLSVGITYLPIPVSGAMMLLFVIERLTIGPPPQDGSDAHVPLD